MAGKAKRINKIVKRPRPKGPRGKMKIGDMVAMEFYRPFAVEFGTIVAISKDWDIITIKFPSNKRRVYDIGIDRVVPEPLFDYRHHAALLNLTTKGKK